MRTCIEDRLTHLYYEANTVDSSIHETSGTPEPLKIGQRIRALRLERGMTIEGLAHASGLTMGFISQVERGLASLSLVSLRKTCRALDVPMFQVLIESENGEGHIVRGDKRIRLRFPDRKAEYQLLSPSLNAGLEVMEVLLGQGEATSTEPMSHRGEEVSVILAGEVLVTYGENQYRLVKGDSIYLVSTVPHRYENAGVDQARVLMAILNAFPRHPDRLEPVGSAALKRRHSVSSK